MGRVVAAFETREMARRAVDELIAAGFGPERVSVMARDEPSADGRAEDLKTVGPLAGVQVGSETVRTHAERLGTEREGQQRRAMAQV